MSGFFIKIVNMSISAGWIVLAVLLLRLLLKKAPKWITVLLWGIVAVRLVCPISMESIMSLIPSAETIGPGIMMEQAPAIHTGIPSINNTINPIITGSLSPNPAASANPLQVWIPILSILWIAGIIFMLVYTGISYWRLKRKISTAVLLHDNIFQSENVGSPFVFGLIAPKIYLPFQMNAQDMELVIAHEQAHICRKDHWWKPLGFLLLTLHWFNPLMWIGYVLLCRDIELACDEKVVKGLGRDERANYSQALLTCSVSRRTIAACPLAFGEIGVKGRVKSVLHYKKPAFWIIVVSVIVCLSAAVCFLTDPVSVRLKDIEDLTLNEMTEEAVTVWAGNGESYTSVGVISQDLLQDLLDLKISKKETSLNRGTDRDLSNTLILQTAQDREHILNSNLAGLYIHFSNDFSFVWVDTAVKPTLSYKVMEPEKAREVYGYIAHYNVRVPILGGADKPESIITYGDLEQLQTKFPMYFNLATDKGLEVYIWQMSEGSYSCGLLPGKNLDYTMEELWNLHQSPTSLAEMRAIVASYLANGNVTKDDIIIHAIQMPHSSYAYVIDNAYMENLNALFWNENPVVEASWIP